MEIFLYTCYNKIGPAGFERNHDPERRTRLGEKAGSEKKEEVSYERNIVSDCNPHRQPGGPEPPGCRRAGERGLHRRRRHPGDHEAPQPPGAEKAHGQLSRTQQGRRRSGHSLPPAGGGELRPGHRRRDPRHLGPRGAPGPPLRGERGSGPGRAGLLRADFRPDGQRAACGAVCL